MFYWLNPEKNDFFLKNSGLHRISMQAAFVKNPDLYITPGSCKSNGENKPSPQGKFPKTHHCIFRV